MSLCRVLHQCKVDLCFLCDGVCFLVFNFIINDLGVVYWEEGCSNLAVLDVKI